MYFTALKAQLISQPVSSVALRTIVSCFVKTMLGRSAASVTEVVLQSRKLWYFCYCSNVPSIINQIILYHNLALPFLLSVFCNKIKMWNLISASKITEQKFKKKKYDLHREKLSNMKPIMHIREPEQPDFVYLKPKLQMARRDKLTEIDRHNEILLNKMQIIKTATYSQNKLRPQAQQLRTLNQHIMNQQAEDIYHENKRICSKLLKVSSYYPTFETIDKTDRLENIRFNISQNARRVASAKSLHSRPQSSYTSRSSKFYRSRVNKYDQEGNSSQEKINILYKMASEAELRPESAPAPKRTSKRYYSEKPSNKRREAQQNQEQNYSKSEVKDYPIIKQGQLQSNQQAL